MIQLHQTLHGYAGGHRLLASSVSLDVESRKDMGVLSDLSGTVMVRGYETYLTVYPLPKAEMYVFARTWYAVEMERPGSVWTHSLLLRFADVARIQHPAALLPVFTRPEGKILDTSRYEEAISFPIGLGAESAEDQVYEASLLTEVFEALYGQLGPVYLPAPDAQRFESLLLDLWAQQWPRLRRIFTFCSGALEPRSLRRRHLDLQVIPRPRARSEGITVSPDSSGPATAEEKWTGVAIRDLRARRLTPLRSFLRQYGVDVAEMRQGFGALAETFYLIGQRATLSELVSHVGSSFPDPTDAAKLKGKIFAVGAGTTREADEAVLAVLGRNPYASAFSDATTELPVRLGRLAHEAPDLLVKALSQIGLPPHGATAKRIVTSAIKELAPGGVVDLLRIKPLWVSEVLRLRPAIVAHDEFWSLPDSVRSDALGILSAVWGREADLWKPVADAVARRDAQAVAQVLAFAGSVLVEALMDALNSPVDRGELPAWCLALEPRTEELITWLAKHPNPESGSRDVLVHVLDPDADAVRQIGVRPWSRVGTEARALRSENDQRQLAFVLALALRSDDGEAEHLAAEIFPHVYALAASNQLMDRNWDLLTRHRPQHGDPPPWDRCEWLRRRLVDAAAAFGWSPKSVVAALPEESARDRAAAYADGFPAGRGLAAALRATLPPPTPPRRRPETKHGPAGKPPEKGPGKKPPKKQGKSKRRWRPF